MNRIKELRLKNKISQTKLAKALNVHQTAVSQWEQGRTSPDMETLPKIADFFGVSTDYILCRDNKSDITFDDFTFAMYNEAKDLTDEDKAALLNMAKLLKKKVEETKE